MPLSRFIFIFLALLLDTSIVLAQNSTDTATATGRLIVTYRADQNASASLGALQGDRKSTDSLHRGRWRASRNLDLSRGLSRQTDLLDTGVSQQHALQALAKLIANESGVESASVEYKRYLLAQPNDPLYAGNQSALGDQSYLYDGEFSMRAPGAWDITTGSQSAVIAIVDTGVLPQHPELTARSIDGLGYDFVSADQPGDFTSANDGDGRDDNPLDPGDFCGTKPSSWHGTGVASVAAGNSNDAIGIAGVDWNARLLHARALGKCGGTDADIIDAIRWSAGLPVPGLPINQIPATVVNLSIGGPTECTPAWQNVINELNNLGIPFVIAAGNEANNALRSSPANCADVITVGSHTPGGDLDSGFSNYGLKVAVAAPGRNIIMATNTGVQDADIAGNDYHRETGSSFSAALVSGAISLMQSLDPGLSPNAIRGILQQSAVPFAAEGDCSNYYCGAGILNLSQAVRLTRDGGYDASSNAENNVITAQLTNLEPGTRVDGALFGYRDIRYYKLTTTETGLLTVQSESDTDLYGYLLDDKFSVLTLDDDSHTAFNFRVAARVPPGNYFLAVERATNRRSDGESTFSLDAELVMDQPDPFNFSAVSNAALNAPVTSESVRLSGLPESTIISVSGGFYSVNGGEFMDSQGTVNNGDTLIVSLQSAAAIDTQTSLMVSVGAYATEFSVTTGDGSTTPTITPSPQNNSSGCVLGSATSRFDPILISLLLLALISVARSRRSS